LRFIIAESLEHARSSAEIDCRWRPIAMSEWRDGDGERVRYVSHAHDLYGRHGALVYLGCNWQDHHEWRDGRFSELVRELALELRHANRAV